jgi:hypothetical protein
MTTCENPVASEIPSSPASREHNRPDRARLTRAERVAFGTGAAAAVVFTAYGFATRSPSTIGYVSSVLVTAAAIMWLRRAALPGLLAAGLAVAAIASLAGGLIAVGHDVLYNASTGPYSPSLGTHYLQYDHFAHAYTSFVVVFACWFILAAPHAGHARRGELILLAVGAALALAVVVLGALTPGYNQWSDTVSRLGSPGERWALAAPAVFIGYGLLVVAGAGPLRAAVQHHGRTLALLLGLYGVTGIVAGLAPKDQPGAPHTAASQVHVASTVVGGALAIGAMVLVASYGLTSRARHAAIVMALVTGLAAAVFRFTWGTAVYGLCERLVLGLGMGWISAQALLLVRQPVLDGVPDQLDPVVQLQLAQGVLHVVLHGAVRQHQPGGDLLVGQAGSDHAQDFGLALGQPRGRPGVPGITGRDRGEPPELAEHQRGEPGSEHRVADGRAPHRVEELAAGRGLQQVPDRARLHRVQHVLLLAAGRQDQHVRRGMGGAQPGRHLDPGHVRQLQVEHHDVGPGRPGHPQRLRAIGRRRHHLVPGLGQVPRDRVAPHRVVVDHHDPDRRVLSHAPHPSPRPGPPPPPLIAAGAAPPRYLRPKT